MSASDASSEPERIDNQSITHLIVVCCHAIWLGGTTKGVNPDEWLIEPFQRGETDTFREHIKTGLRILHEQPRSLLVFSGAATKDTTQTTFAEGESYLALAHQLEPLNYPTHLKAECQATDSYQNLLFSIIHFRRVTSHYPTHITIISLAVKRRRFMGLHVPAIRFPTDKVTYVGIDPPENVTTQYSLIQGEQARGYGVWKWDLYGVGAALSLKRRDRGWDNTVQTFWIKGKEERGARQAVVLGMNLEEGVRDLLRWEGGVSGTEVFAGELPWDGSGDDVEQDGNAQKWPAVNDADRG